MALSRRDFLGSIAVGAAFKTAAHGAQLQTIGLQLYTVRDFLKSDFEGTLRTVALAGYQEVEFAGLMGADVRRTRDLLGDLGLAAPSIHAEYSSLQNNPDRSFDIAGMLDARFVVCPWLDPPERRTADDWKRVCENFNVIGELAARSGLTFAYHNHDFEFAKLSDGIVPFDMLLSRTDERFVKFELDVYWAKKGNVDPATFLRAHRSRIVLVHLKDMAPDGSFTEVGNGTIDFIDVVKASLQGGVRHFFVEQDDSPDPFRSIRASIAYLRKTG